MASTDVDKELETLIRARYPLIYIVSWEEKRVEDALRNIAQARGKKIFFWTITQGMVMNPNHRDNATRDPLAALDFVMDSRDQALFVLKDYHAFISDVTVTRRLRDLTSALKTSYKTLVVLAPLLKLPSELEKDVTVVDYGLPDLVDLDQILEGIVQAVKDNPHVNTTLTPIERDQILKAAQGLTANEAENVLAKSLVEKQSFDVDVILSEKEQIIRKSGILEYYPFNERIGDVGGLDLLKDWMEKRTVAFTEQAREFGLPSPRGVLLLGVQGCGKSLSAKAIGALWRLPLLRLDVGRIFAGIVGSSEENMRKAIRVAESVAPCVSGKTPITLADGSERTIQEIYESDGESLEVLSMTARGKIEPSRVKAVTRREAPDLFHVKLRHAQLEATSNHLHPVLREGECVWVRTDELRKGDHVAIARHVPTPDTYPALLGFLPQETRIYAPNALSYAPLEAQTPQRRYAAQRRGADFVRVSELQHSEQMPPWELITRFERGSGGTATSVLTRLPEQPTPEMGYLLGLLASDGYIGSTRRLGFVNTDKNLHIHFAEIVQRLFGVTVHQRLNVVPERVDLKGLKEGGTFRPCYTSYVDNSLLCAVLRCVEAHLLSMPKPLLQAWVRGYFDGDGYIAATSQAVPKIVLTAKRKTENALVRSVLRRVGFPTTNPESANIEITGATAVLRFIQEIGCQHPCKQERMEAWGRLLPYSESKDRTDCIPVGAKLRSAREALGVKTNQLSSIGSSLLSGYERNRLHPNRERLRQWLLEMQEVALTKGITVPQLQEIADLVASPVGWSPVLSVESLPTPDFVYDLVCEAPHNFLCGSLFTHNCILWLDELEKGFSGTQSSGSSDGGTTSRVFGTFLTWMQDKKAPAFVVATSNDVTALPPELLRKGRFDEIFFIDLPAEPEREQIFKIHLEKRKRKSEDFDLTKLAKATPGFSGAEIEASVVEALYDAFDDQKELTTESILQAIRNSVPLAMTMQERIEGLRIWAADRARAASSIQSEDLETIREELIVQKHQTFLEGATAELSVETHKEPTPPEPLPTEP